MAGHSKWKNIQRRKNAQDSKRGKIFMKLAKDIFIAAKEGGGDPDMNPSLRLAVDKAKINNMPNENIDRAIKKATGNLDGVSYEELIYEGYGPGGTAVMVQIVTDNKNRAAAEVRHAFSKNGGNLGENGCVAFMFSRKGYIVIDRVQTAADEDEIMLEAIEAGAEEMETSNEAYEIYTEPEKFNEVRKQLEENGYVLETAEVTMIPETYTQLNEEEAKSMLNLVEMLENIEDVQDVYHNMDVDDELLDQL
ncbi:YebC/PmpR family DNA-binding transcriptional regulator [Aquibacillus sp. 3ASR75-11]|uniref:Probable transcriptional regulatory protein NC797_04995 n=1 Tax=Terrihalobacillus insolitus TaxID=2950438 RepID=A0A9X4AL51_9BACI|nr:YebC/PmpR family DNA-binding transcriptional regulator [Terrihalobacillus insolitus]MDC3412446.1 YebC/PmpR family DNA-binding transcriptional regulator [Terrihalobacillus insolitus]MDC3423866.1 YebC/PmpR family DNA-binding transcriptional regulator [Terrihalobacillus insolitus]